MPLGENSYSFLLANKICLQLKDMPNSDSYYKSWVWIEVGRGAKKEGKNTVKGAKRGQDGGKMGTGDGFQLSLWIVLSAVNMENMYWF